MAVVRQILARVAGPAGVIGLLALLAAGVIYVAEGGLTVPARILLVLAGVGLLAFVWGSPETVGDIATSRTARYGSLSLVMTLAFIGILVLANYWASRHTTRWDLTQEQLYSLAPQSKEILQRLDEPVQVLAFIPSDDARKQRAEDLLREYAALSPQFSYEIVDPDLNPAQATRYGVRNYGDVIFVGDNLTQTATTIDESSFTSALLRITSPVSQTVYFLTGHGERSIETFGDVDISKAKTALERDNYTVKTLSLITATEVPTDANAVIIAQAKSPLLPEEAERLQIYLGNGGSLLVLADYNSTNPAPELLKDWGFEIGEGLVIDPATAFFGGDPTSLVIQASGYQLPEITQDLGASVLPLATMITATQLPLRNATPRMILQSSPQSWLEKDTQRAEFTEGTDQRGPIPLAFATEATAPGALQQAGSQEEGAQQRARTRIAVFGDTDFIANVIIDRVPGNQDLFLNSVHWLTQSDQLVTIRPKPPIERNLLLSGSQSLWLFLSSFVILPGIVPLAGGLVWWGRR